MSSEDFQRPSGHSIFAPSSAHMFLACAASLRENLALPDTAEFEAAFGTVGHDIAADWLRLGGTSELSYELMGETMLGRKRDIVNGGVTYTVEVTSEMLDIVEQYVKWCEELPGQHYIETRIDFSVITPIPAQGGTADHFAVIRDTAGEVGAIVGTDLKTGYVVVRAYQNPQLLLYMYGVLLWLFPGYKTIPTDIPVSIRIAQPRLKNFDTWEVTSGYVLQWATWAQTRMAEAWTRDAPFRPGVKQCRYCKKNTTCAALHGQLHTIADASFDDLENEDTGERGSLAMLLDGDEIPAGMVARMADDVNVAFGYRWHDRPSDLSTMFLSHVLTYEELFTGWFGRIREELEARIRNGERAPGWKLVDGRNARREWLPNKDVADMLDLIGVDRDKAYTRKPISPKQAEDLAVERGFRKRDAELLFDHMVLHVPGKETLAPDEDVRESRIAIADQSFDDLENDGL